jgi:hypothetical protein
VQDAGFASELSNTFGILPLHEPSTVGKFKGEEE